jgi:hydrogenase nickel incorporation protein HypA/HybF
MHELGIALSIIETAEYELQRHEANRVLTVWLRMGPLAGVSKDALLFAYPLACEGTRLEGSILSIDEMPDGAGLEIVSLEVE